MDTQKIFNWIQLVTGLSVVAGIGLVILELQQTREIAELQIASDGFAQYASGVRVFIGENPAAAWAKACDDPDSMTTEDMFVMSNILNELLNRIRAIYQRQEVSPDLMNVSWDQWAVNFTSILSTEYGRWWWRNQQFYEPEIVSVGNDYLERGEFGECSEYYETYRNRNVADTP